MSLCYSQLTLSDRRRLHQLIERKVPVGDIARQLGRHRSTIYREVKRNTFHDAEFPEYSGYYSGIANDLSRERRRRLCKLRRHPQLRELVIDRLKALWSPEQIAGCIPSNHLQCRRKVGPPRHQVAVYTECSH